MLTTSSPAASRPMVAASAGPGTREAVALVQRLHSAGVLRPEREEIPAPSADEVLLRVTAVGLCGSDLHWFTEGGIGDTGHASPLVLGHEFAAVVAAGPRRGERVAVDPAIPCDTCETCRAGHRNLCPKVRFAGHGSVDGALRDYMTWPARNLHRVPDSLDDAAAAMLEPLGVALHALELGHLLPGMTVGVFGVGPIGLLLVQLALVAGAARVLATDVLSHRLHAARDLGAEPVTAAPDGAERHALDAMTGGRGVDVAFEAAGENAAVETAVAAVRPGGRVVLVGIPADDRTSFRASEARRKGLTLAVSRRMGATYPRAIGLVESGTVDIERLITHRFPLANAGEAFEVLARREGIKVIVEPHGHTGEVG